MMIKSKNGTATRSITYLFTDTLPVVVLESVFPLLPLGRYLMSLTELNRYETTDSNGTFYFIIISRNVSIVRYEFSGNHTTFGFIELSGGHLGKTQIYCTIYQKFNRNKLIDLYCSPLHLRTIALSGRLSCTMRGTSRLICFRTEPVTDKSSQFESHGLVVWSDRLHKEPVTLTDEREITVSVCVSLCVSPRCN